MCQWVRPTSPSGRRRFSAENVSTSWRLDEKQRDVDRFAVMYSYFQIAANCFLSPCLIDGAVLLRFAGDQLTSLSVRSCDYKGTWKVEDNGRVEENRRRGKIQSPKNSHASIRDSLSTYC